MPQGVKGPVERRFDRKALRPLEIEQIGWWDITHQKCLIGDIKGRNGGKEFSFVFERYKNRRLGPEREYCDKKIVKLNVKFENEGRFGLDWVGL